MSLKIKKTIASEILDSRGNPTVETTIHLSNKQIVASSTPSGASKSTYEAVELRDHDKNRFFGLGVLQAVKNVNQIIGPAINSLDVEKQEIIDQLMIDLDGTKQKSHLGANAILSVSQALIKAAALSKNLPVYDYLRKKYSLAKNKRLPKFLFNIINGGKHGDCPLNFQEFHIIPWLNKPIYKSLEIGDNIYKSLKKVLQNLKLDTDIGDEGGFSPNILTNLDAFLIIKKAVCKAGYILGKDVKMGLDAAATSFYKKNKYELVDFAKFLTAKELTEYYLQLAEKFPLVYLEDPFFENDWKSWQKFLQAFQAKKIKAIGDDLVTTNSDKIKKAGQQKAVSAVIIKPNQVGTITETIKAIKMARKYHLDIVVSHRSGETNDDFIADFAIGVGADMVKFGAPARGERVAKYNRLLKIEKNLK